MLRIFLTELDIKLPSKLLSRLPHLTRVHAGPGKNGTHDINFEMSKKRRKNVLDIISCNFENDEQVLIIFGANIADTASY